MPLPEGFDPDNPWCPKCNASEMWDNRRTKKNPKQPCFKCKDKACGHGLWEYAPGQGAPQRTPQQQRQPQQAARPQAQPQSAAPRQQVSFDAALAAGREAVVSIGAALHDVAKQAGVPIDTAAWFTATASVACSYVIALSGGCLRLGPAEPEPAKPLSAKDQYMERLRLAPDTKALSKVIMAYASDTTLNGVEKEELGAFAEQCGDTLSLVSEMN